MITETGPIGPARSIAPEPLVAPSRPVRPRWAVAVIAAVLVLAASIGVVLGVFLASPRGGAAAIAAGYVPANATLYYELRMDLPGDQRASLEQFLGHFAKVDTQTVLGDGLDTALDQMFTSTTAPYSYTKDLKPWMTGQVALAMLGVPSLTASSQQLPTALVFVGARDADAAAKLLATVRIQIGTAGTEASSEEYAGVTIWTWNAPVPSGPGPTLTASAAVTDDQLIIGIGKDVIHTALDVRDGKTASLANRSEFRDGLTRLPVDRVLTYAVDVSGLMDAASQSMASAAPQAAALYQAAIKSAPSFAMGSARFESDRLVMDAASAYASGATIPALPKGLASEVPGDAIFYAGAGNVGAPLSALVDTITSAVAGTPGSEQLSQVQAALGTDLGSFFTWMGDTAFVASWDGSEPAMGLIIKATDAQEASRRMLQLQGLLQLSGGQGGPKATITEAQHGDARITTIAFTADATTPAWATTIQYTVTDDRVVIGLGTKFVASVLDTTNGRSLAGQQRFRDAASMAGGSTDEASFWLDLAKLRDAVVSALPQDASNMYRTQAESWVSPFDYAIGVAHASGQTVTGRVVIAVK